ncbi:cytochrome b5 [Serendipita vermifera]|nr:cytochrome b5 [Serendipita vermifera]
MTEKFKPPPARKEPFPPTLGSNPTPTSKLGDDPILEPPLPKVKDSYGRMISTKKANMPFISYKKWKDAEEAKEKRKKLRQEKKERGEPLSDWEDDPDAPREEESFFVTTIKTLFIIVAIVALSGKFVTGSMTWGYQGKWVQWRTYWPFEGSGSLFTEQMLAKYDGSDPKLPIYLAIDGDVYDVSANRATYGPGGSYHLMVGVDAARSFGTGCFKDHRTHDLRGLTEEEMQGVNHWKKFFKEKDKYRHVGKVIHPPIDPKSPIPRHCKEDKQKAAGTAHGPKNKGRTDL